MINEFLKFTIVSLRQRKLRSWLTMIGIFIGAFYNMKVILEVNGVEDFERFGYSDKNILTNIRDRIKDKERED